MATVDGSKTLDTVVRVRDAGCDGPERFGVRVYATELGIEIAPDGLGVLEMEVGAGAPIFIERYNGRWRLLVWADINYAGPTHVIDLSGAAEAARCEE